MARVPTQKQNMASLEMGIGKSKERRGMADKSSRRRPDETLPLQLCVFLLLRQRDTIELVGAVQQTPASRQAEPRIGPGNQKERERKRARKLLQQQCEGTVPSSPFGTVIVVTTLSKASRPIS